VAERDGDDDVVRGTVVVLLVLLVCRLELDAALDGDVAALLLATLGLREVVELREVSLEFPLLAPVR
jgi:hypothetical protein